MSSDRFGDYTLVRRLGKGGMAEVFLARTPSVGGFEKLVAIKRLLPPYNVDSHILSMLADEARLSAWLTHPGIVQVLDFGRVGKTYFIAMEYVEGCDLCDLIRPAGKGPGRPLPLPTALFLMTHVAEALDYAHRRCNQAGEHLSIIHRDVSPHNILLSSEGQVKLADFGLARASVSVHKSREGVIRGKFSYMPREQAHGLHIDHRIDLFGAGVTLYEALTGSKPYTSKTLAEQLYQLEKPVPPPSSIVPDIPEEIDDLALQAMSPNPEERYQSAEELARDLRSALLRVSTFAQEERQLTALVRSSLSARGIARERQDLGNLSLAELRVTERNLIGDELLAVQKSTRPVAQTPSAAAHPRETDDEPTRLFHLQQLDTSALRQLTGSAPPGQSAGPPMPGQRQPPGRGERSLPGDGIVAGEFDVPSASGPLDHPTSPHATNEAPGVEEVESNVPPSAPGQPPSAAKHGPFAPAGAAARFDTILDEGPPASSSNAGPYSPPPTDIPGSIAVTGHQHSFATADDPRDDDPRDDDPRDIAPTIQRSREHALDAFQLAMDERRLPSGSPERKCYTPLALPQPHARKTRVAATSILLLVGMGAGLSLGWGLWGGRSTDGDHPSPGASTTVTEPNAGQPTSSNTVSAAPVSGTAALDGSADAQPGYVSKSDAQGDSNGSLDPLRADAPAAPPSTKAPGARRKQRAAPHQRRSAKKISARKRLRRSPSSPGGAKRGPKRPTKTSQHGTKRPQRPTETGRPAQSPPPVRSPDLNPPEAAEPVSSDASAASAAASGEGTLRVSASPKALIFIDSSSEGTPTPANIKLEPGVHTVRVRFVDDDVTSDTRFITVKSGQTTRVNFVLDP